MAHDQSSGATVARPSTTVVAQAVAFAAAGKPILNGIDLSLVPGERLGVIGPNGSGKSTLLRCLYAWHRPTGGAVLLDGTPIDGVPARARARRLAVMAQEAEPGLGLTVEEVVALGRLPHRDSWARLSDHDRHAIDRALALIGLDGWCGRAFATLSGGEKQRVLFARALAQQPALLILDEPTNHLDIRHQLEVLDVARRLGVGVIATLHDLNLAARWCDRLCLMVEGRVRAVGLASEVLTPALVSEAYGVAVERDDDPRSGAPRLCFYLDSRISQEISE